MTSKPRLTFTKLLLSGVLTALAFGACKGPVVWNGDVKSFVQNGMLGIKSALSNLVINSVLPNGVFSFETTNYSRGLFYDLASVTFTATGGVAGQQLQYRWDGGNWTSISSGVASPALTTILNATASSGTVNTLEVKVTAVDGQETTTYTVQFSDDGPWAVKSALSNLVVATVLPNGNFSVGTTSYPRGVFLNLTSVTFTATGAVSGQQLQYAWNGGNWTTISSGVASPALTVVENAAVNNGTDNTLQLKVTAVDGQTTTTYTVQFSKGYTITYDSDYATGGTVPTDSTVYEAGQSVTILGAVATLTEPEGTFNNVWNSAANGTGTSYPAGSTLTMTSGGVIVYAKWQGTYTPGQTITNGGIVFYDQGYYNNGFRYLAAASSDQTSAVWSPNNTQTGTTSWNIGDGLSNTQTIVKILGAGSYAADICYTYGLGGYTWFLPTESELYQMYTVNGLYGLNLTGTFYWSSTETGNPAYAYVQNISTGQQPSYMKGAAWNVRAIREF